MRTGKRTCFFAAMILFIFCASAGATETARKFFDGIKSYQSGDYTSAIKAFSEIAESGVNNGALFYNLGNACLKNGDIGHAIWNYERALKTIPGDPDLKFNHEYALSQTKDARDEKNSVFRILFFWKHSLDADTVRWTAIILNVVFWTTVTVRAVRKRKIFRSYMHLILIPVFVFTVTAFYNYYEANYVKKAVVLPAEVSIRSGLSGDSTELFKLHAGTKVRIEEEREDFFKIFFSEGKIGWIGKAELGVI